MTNTTQAEPKRFRLDTTSDRMFMQVLSLVGGLYVLLIVGMLVADIAAVRPTHIIAAFTSPEIRYAVKLSLFSCFMTGCFSLLISVPLAYVISRLQGPWRHVLDILLDIPFVLPPVVIGLSLLLLFNSPWGRAIERIIPVSYAVPGVILAQFPVACAFALRIMRSTFEQMNPRLEQVALTLGCSQQQVFRHVVLPQARRGMLAAFTLAWSRSLGEFGPVMIFAGTIRMHTEVLPTSVFFEINDGHIELAVAIALLMILLSTIAMFIVRLAGMPGVFHKGVV